ncbi:MAG: heme-binding domain-containing protein [Sphingobacteriales bacterium]|nr:heme-binding domain-containing protein [Sphingobacteriales bacterium]
MSVLKKILLLLLLVLMGIQFIRPVRNESGQLLSTDITKTFNIPDSVLNVLKMSCYDCHSNNTNYPFYVNIEPVGWILNNHIKNGKDKLNFSDFGSYSQRRQMSKFKSIASQIQDDKMPISSYLILHKKAVLSSGNKELIINWANKTRDSLSSNQ